MSQKSVSEKIQELQVRYSRNCAQIGHHEYNISLAKKDIEKLLSEMRADDQKIGELRHYMKKEDKEKLDAENKALAEEQAKAAEAVQPESAQAPAAEDKKEEVA